MENLQLEKNYIKVNSCFKSQDHKHAGSISTFEAFMLQYQRINEFVYKNIGIYLKARLVYMESYNLNNSLQQKDK